jgi:hypothetical protein
MKKSLTLLVTMVLCLCFVSPVLAYTGVDGLVVDSVTLAPWTWGADVGVVDVSTGTLIAGCMLNPVGQIVGLATPQCLYGLPPGPPVSPIPPLPGDSMLIVIDFSCSTTGGCSGGPSGTPAIIQIPYTEAVGAGLYSIPAPVPTGTGPNVVQLTGMSGSSGLAITLILAVVTGGSLVLKKKSQKELQTIYQAPEVVQDGVLEVQAGTTGDDIVDGLFGDWE